MTQGRVEDSERPASRCRIHLDAELQSGRETAIPAEQAHYLRHVMRLNADDSVTVFNGTGGEYRASISRLSRDHASLRVEAFDDISRELPLAVHIVQSASKSEKIETVLQKGTELGAAGFQIVVSERSQFRLPESKRESRLGRWRKIIIEAAEQSGRTMLPTLAYCDALGELSLQQQAYVLHPAAHRSFAAIREQLASASAISLAVGPEGGFSERDLQQLQDMGCDSVSFGPRIMRTETAAPALLAAIAGVL